ncbi:S-adenosyl-L-methionine-dependent methyltransferase [Pseudomassariella vexata]|uniref:S-adenosyl-L-methionine-dependent methyltransferase n=1 Tax=Pseudomassariella vexata TaxID=1141098 RepID=A0A1Y2DXT3_9PEZI|nr:S-adenosyl-L-methionine-dependent methyltransferase [Pseudomassariella vexata]ORY64081.1 S-adenosyl-L-methionine-dependent methyltransferase [Pseudomassariella vexata]
MSRITTAASAASAAGISQPQEQPALNKAALAAAPESYEQTHVHNVYESIASHFSSTRYKPWPVIASFLSALPPGSVGLDVGCGNGKYLAVNPNVFILGSDRSANLVRIARDHSGERRCEVAVADGLSLPYREGSVDFAICVAVIHHMSTRDRRREAVGTLLGSVVEGGRGKVLVYVWALEQGNSRRGWDARSDQDQLVPWVMKAKQGGVDGPGNAETTYQRYYHLYRKGELEEDVLAVGGRVVESGYDRDNWWVVASRA